MTNIEELSPAERLVETHVLVSIANGRLDLVALRSLPRWRAALLARIAYKARLMTRADLDELVREVAVLGELRPARR